jgi:hypothetical protein
MTKKNPQISLSEELTGCENIQVYYSGGIN